MSTLEFITLMILDVDILHVWVEPVSLGDPFLKVI